MNYVTFKIIETRSGEFVLFLHNHSRKLVSEVFRSKILDEVVKKLKDQMDYRKRFMSALSNYGPVLNIIDELTDCGPLDIASGETTIIIMLGQTGPTFLLLTDDVVLARLTLGVQRVELLLEPHVGAFTGVDRTANSRALVVFCLAHCCPFVSPKKW